MRSQSGQKLDFILTVFVTDCWIHKQAVGHSEPTLHFFRLRLVFFVLCVFAPESSNTGAGSVRCTKPCS